MSVSGIQGHPLEVTVFGCTRLKDTEWISRQDPYVCVEYGGNKFRTRTCTDGGKNPTFQEKFVFTLTEGLREINVAVWNSNTLTYDTFIGSGKIHLHKVLSQGFDDATWSLQTNTGRYAGEVRLIMQYANANRAATGNANSAPPYGAPVPQAHGAYYSQPPTAYPVSFPYPSYPPSSAYPPSAYPPPPPATYPHAPYPAPSVYPPQPYPPPPQASALFLESTLHTTKVTLQNVKCEEATSRMNCFLSRNMSVSGIQGHPLEVTVFGCTRLKDTEWISRQDPYVFVEYGGIKFRTRTCTDGGKNPTFQEKFVFTLIEGLREINVAVWNSNTLTNDTFIGSGKIHLHKVLSQGYDDATWSLQTNTGRYAGEVRLIMHYANANRAATGNANSAPPYGAPVPQAHGAYYSQPPTAYPVSFPYPSYPPSSAYPPSAYPPPPPATYPHAPYPAPSVYPPQPYPPPPQASVYYPPGPFPGIYPPHY
ncbi:hypothetical protein SADUNF_Sadunf16G0183000 [Salix dunnii]|uniref:C2 domain-containing protein n=1 Tax=Salix dunnii TaxID=1413687 RepID=A0A835JAV1_9ROSI|nr:hypothetical protein SADUNF_Sadunf16G0183000 [Salix dunnii]